MKAPKIFGAFLCAYKKTCEDAGMVFFRLLPFRSSLLLLTLLQSIGHEEAMFR